MKKKFLSLIVAVCMIFSCFFGLVACGPQQEEKNAKTWTEAEVVGTYKIGSVVMTNNGTNVTITKNYVAEIADVIVSMVEATMNAQEAQSTSEVEEQEEELSLATRITNLIWGIYENARLTLNEDKTVDFHFAEGYEFDQETFEEMTYGLSILAMSMFMPSNYEESESGEPEMVSEVEEQEEDPIEAMVEMITGIIENLEFTWAIVNNKLVVSLVKTSLGDFASFVENVDLSVAFDISEGKLTKVVTAEAVGTIEEMIPSGGLSSSEPAEASETEQAVPFESITIELTKVIEEAAA